MLAGCASAPLGPFQYSPDEKAIKGYQRVDKALRTTLNNIEVTTEPLTMEGLVKILKPGEKVKEVGYVDTAGDKIRSSMVFYVTIDNKGKEQAVFTPTKTRLIYERKNWYKINSSDTLTPLDYADFHVFLTKIKEARERLEVISGNVFHGATLISPGQKKSGLIFFPWKEKDEEVVSFRLSIMGLFVGTEPLDFSFNFKVEPVTKAR